MFLGKGGYHFFHEMEALVKVGNLELKCVGLVNNYQLGISKSVY